MGEGMFVCVCGGGLSVLIEWLLIFELLHQVHVVDDIS